MPEDDHRARGAATVKLELLFDDIMEFALALLALSPAELETLKWSFRDRKRFLDYLLASGKVAQGKTPAELKNTAITLHLPAREARRLQAFAQRDLPKAATNAGMLHRVDQALARALIPMTSV